MKVIHNALKKKGWKDSEINNLIHVIDNAESKKTRIQKNFEYSSFWIILLGFIIINFVVVYALMPFFIILDKLIGLIVVFITAIFVGTLFCGVIHHYEKKIIQHIIYLIIIPLSSFINVFFISLMAKDISSSLNLIMINPIIIASIYSLSLILPYFFYFGKEMFLISKK